MKVSVTAAALLFTAGKTQNFTRTHGEAGATLVGEPPLFSHKLLLLVTSTGFRSCQRETRGHHVRGAESLEGPRHVANCRLAETGEEG